MVFHRVNINTKNQFQKVRNHNYLNENFLKNVDIVMYWIGFLAQLCYLYKYSLSCRIWGPHSLHVSLVLLNGDSLGTCKVG